MTNPAKKISVGKLRFPVEKSTANLFFSLVDYRNNYFTSDDPDKIIEFYNGFENRCDLIKWMKERPKGATYIHEIEGDNDIIVVIPTADFNGKYAKECRDNIFKGLHMIFVESGGRMDFYFNFAHNVNIGIMKALEYSPKWVIFSGDDVIKVDDVSILTSELREIDNELISMPYIYPPQQYSGKIEYISEKRRLPKYIGSIMRFVRPTFSSQENLDRKFDLRYVIKEGAPYIDGSIKSKGIRFLEILYYKHLYKYIDFVSFGIFSSNMLHTLINVDGYIFDENFVMGNEDFDLSIRISIFNFDQIPIKYKVRFLVGGTLGIGKDRILRCFAGHILTSYKISQWGIVN